MPALRNRALAICVVPLVLSTASSDIRGAESEPQKAASAYAGAASCRSCHEGFYKLWATSHHGTAMQPFSADFAREHLTVQKEAIVIGERLFRFEADDSGGWLRETSKDSEAKHAIEHVLGGKNVFYFLTPLDRGRLQVIPVAYDVHKRKWFSTPASAVRHFADEPDEMLDWREREFTFNASCYGCHVSQLSTNYDPKTDTYHTKWAEPGINCETCHGAGGEHVRIYTEAAKTGKKPADSKLISMSSLTATQRDDACAACHAKLIPLSADFKPGERFFDHFDLTTLENRDFHPDGRDLGENYTYTSWLMNPCVKAGQLECLHCHTSSGRDRFANKTGAEANGACLPCHAKRVENITAHSRHKVDGPAGRCVACHMPKTAFARMNRSDHSLRPPMPAATLAFDSPNACNICHDDKDAEWANEKVKSWHEKDYQAATIRVGKLVAASRAGDWSKLKQIGAYLADPKRDAVFASGLVRLLDTCGDDAKWPILLRAARDASPLVRASAVAGLALCPLPEATDALLIAARDDFRVVRIRAGASFAGRERLLIEDEKIAKMKRAQGEFVEAMQTRLDDPGSHMNLGNFHSDRGDSAKAIASFDSALRIDPRSVPARVNASMEYNMIGENDRAEALLRDAIRLDPGSAAAQLNLGLLLGEQGKLAEAITALRAALQADPDSAVAAYNLAILLAQTDLKEAIALCKKAAQIQPGAPRYAYTLAFYLRQAGDANSAIEVLEGTIARHASFADAHMLLGRIHVESGNTKKARETFERAAAEQALPENARRYFATQAQALSVREG